MKEKLIQLITKYEKELREAEDSVDYWYGRRNTSIIQKTNYIKAEKEVSILRQKIKELKKIVEE